MFNPKDEVEVRKANDPNDGRAGTVAGVLPVPFAYPGTDISKSRRYDIAFEGGTEHAEYAQHELVKVAPIAKAGG